MTLQALDKAVLEKIRKVFDNTFFMDEVNYFTSIQSSETERNPDAPGKIILPMITINRIANSPNLSAYGNDAMIRRGFVHNAGESGSFAVKEFPIDCTYQISIWSNLREQVDGMWGELLFYLYEDPEIEVIIDGLNLHRLVPVQIESTEIGSDYTTFDEQGKLHSQFITITVPQARLYRTVDNPVILSIPVKQFMWNGKDLVETGVEVDEYTIEAEEPNEL